MSIETIMAELREKRDRLNRAISALEEIELPKAGAKAVPASVDKKRRGLTPEGRKRLSERMTKRWAEWRKKKRASQGRK